MHLFVFCCDCQNTVFEDDDDGKSCQKHDDDKFSGFDLHLGNDEYFSFVKLDVT